MRNKPPVITSARPRKSQRGFLLRLPLCVERCDAMFRVAQGVKVPFGAKRVWTKCIRERMNFNEERRDH